MVHNGPQSATFKPAIVSPVLAYCLGQQTLNHVFGFINSLDKTHPHHSRFECLFNGWADTMEFTPSIGLLH